MTNREKFTEIFGCEIAQHDNGEAIPGHCKILIASDRHFNDWLKQEYVQPSAQPDHIGEVTEMVGDVISRQAAIDATWFEPSYTDPLNVLTEVRDRLKALPSAQPEPLSDAYTKAVWTWLLEYQIKAAELKGRYTPYEVLSWVANDWRKEHERSDWQTGGD